MFGTAKSNLHSLPFGLLGEQCSSVAASERPEIIADFSNKFRIKTEKTWVYPQLTAAIAKWGIFRDSNGKIDGTAVVKHNVVGNPTEMGYYFFVMNNSREIRTATSAEGLPYCALVPLILMAHKKYNGIKYSEWTNIKTVVNPSLYEAMSTPVPEYTVDELLSAREEGLMKAGVLRDAAKAYLIYKNQAPIIRADGTEIPGLGSCPSLSRMMLCQTWAAHPSNRHEYMILDPNDWDRMPPALLSTEVVKETKVEPKSGHIVMPWDE